MENRVFVSVSGHIDESGLRTLLAGSRFHNFKRFKWLTDPERVTASTYSGNDAGDSLNFAGSDGPRQPGLPPPISECERDIVGGKLRHCIAEFHLENEARRAVEELAEVCHGDAIVHVRMATMGESDFLLATDPQCRPSANVGPLHFSLHRDGLSRPRIPAMLQRWSADLSSNAFMCSSPVEVDILPCHTAGTGCKVWDCSVVLGQLLASWPGIVDGRVVIELGAGLGLPSVVSAMCNPMHVYATELVSELLKILEVNLQANLTDSQKSRVTVQRLDWLDVQSDPWVCPLLRSGDLVTASDGVFDAATALGLAAACDACVSEGGIIIAVLPQARAGLAAFLSDMRERGFQQDCCQAVPPQGTAAATFPAAGIYTFLRFGLSLNSMD